MNIQTSEAETVEGKEGFSTKSFVERIVITTFAHPKNDIYEESLRFPVVAGSNRADYKCNGDLNHNKQLDVEDITLLINGYLTGEKVYGNGSNIESGHRFVDLGLSVMWAETNIGADTHDDYGDFFAWGETEPKTQYTWKSYKLCEGNSGTLTKYNNNAHNGTVDNKTVLDPEDDAAHVNWGGSWRMPTSKEVDELIKQCTWLGLSPGGFIVKGPNGCSIFLPATRSYDSETLGRIDSYDGKYWTNSLGGFESSMAWYMTFSYNWRISNWDIYIDYRTGSRCRGRCVRPVCP